MAISGAELKHIEAKALRGVVKYHTDYLKKYHDLAIIVPPNEGVETLELIDEIRRLHSTIKTTPAIKAGITNKIWKKEDIVKLIERREKSN